MGRTTVTESHNMPQKATRGKKQSSTQNSDPNSGSKRGRVENLKPWPKGVSGNPGGRPKVKALSHAYRAHLEQVVPTDPEGRTYAEVIAAMLAKKAVEGDVAAARELADRTEGRAPQSVTLEKPEDPLLKKPRHELVYFAQTGFWPTPEELEYYSVHQCWPEEGAPQA